MLVDGGHSIVAGAMEETPLDVRLTFFLLYVTLLNLQRRPQCRILDPLNLKRGKHAFLCIILLYELDLFKSPDAGDFLMHFSYCSQLTHKMRLALYSWSMSRVQPLCTEGLIY